MRLGMLSVIWIAACESSSPPSSINATATRVVAEDALFHANPRWLGGDGAYTIDLGGDRSVWLFGDSFIATSDAHVRTESAFIRNSIAIMAGRDVATATMTFAWRDASPPTSFFPEQADHWFWPGGGVRVAGGPLLVFMGEVRATPNQGLGFAGAGLRAFRIPNPDAAPTAWTIEPTTAHAPSWEPASNVACTTVEGDHVVALVTGDADHNGRLARWPLAELGGDLANPEWWTGTTWTAEQSLTGTPPVVIADGATECSLHFDQPTQTWIYLWSRGFGGSTLAIRTSASLTGTWSAPRDLLKPPESSVANAFVYAGKAHVQLRSADGTIPVTFADNSFTFSDVLDPVRGATLYWPHVAHLNLAR